MVVETKPSPSLRVVKQSEFVASCDCEDFYRHRDFEHTRADFLTRKRNARLVRATDYEIRYGSVVVKVETRDRRGRRRHEVFLGRGDGDPWVCKHVICALRSRAMMPDYRHKTVVLSEVVARSLARMYAGKLVKRSREPDVVVTSVNGVWVVGWWREPKA